MFDAIKSALFTEEPKPQAPAAKPQPPIETEQQPRSFDPLESGKFGSWTGSITIKQPTQEKTTAADIQDLRAKVEPAGGLLSRYNAAVASLAEIIPDETMRSKAALQMLKSQGVPAEAIIAECEKVLTEIQNQGSIFEASRKRFEREQINEPLRLAGELEQEIAGLRAKQDVYRQTAESAQQKIDAGAAVFKGASETLLREYRDCISQLKSRI